MWRRFARSTTPTSPRTWRESLPSWRSWTTPTLSPYTRSSLSSTSTDVWSSTSSFGGNLGDSFGSERIERCRRRRAGCSSTVIIISLTTMATMPTNMSVTLKEVFQLKYVQKRNNIVCSGFAPRWGIVILATPHTRSRLQGIRYLSNSVAMMGVIDHDDDVGNDDANDDADDANDNDANADDEHKWKWLMMRTIRRTLLTIWCCSNVFPISSHHISSLFSSYFKSPSSPNDQNTQVQILDRQIWDWYHLCLYQVMMVMVVMENKMIMTMMMRNTSGNDCFFFFKLP